ncbi:MAG: tetratricopeptide repeat protein [bacterium]|nr:tetratricopeptide repeat protein [bacterium]
MAAIHIRLATLGLLTLLAACAAPFAAAQEQKQPPRTQQEKGQPSLREQAYGAENRGEFKEAAKAFQQLVAQQPYNPEWIVSAGRCLGMSGSYADAIDLLDKGAEKFPGALEITAMMARTYLLKGERDRGALNPQSDYAEAAQFAERVLAIDPNHADSRLVLAQARYLLGEWDEASRQAEAAVKRHPGRSGAHILLGRIAMDRLRRLLDVHGTGTLKGQALADLVAEISAERRTAQAAFTQAGKLDDRRAHPHVMLARLALLEKRKQQARTHLLDALAIDPDDPFVDHAMLQRGNDWQATQAMYSGVRQRYTARAKYSPEKAATLRWYEGAALFAGRQWQGAREAFEAVLKADPTATNSYYYAALAAYELGDHDGAERHAGDYAATSAVGFADVVRSLGAEMRGQVAAIVKYLADRAYQRGDIPRSRDLNHVIALLYDTADAWNNRAFLCRETKKFPEALAAYRRALEKEPTSPQLTNDTAVVLHYHLPNPRNLAEAKELYQRAITLAEKVLADAAATPAAKAAAKQAKSDAEANLQAMK